MQEKIVILNLVSGLGFAALWINCIAFPTDQGPHH